MTSYHILIFEPYLSPTHTSQMSLSCDRPKKGLVFTALRGTGKDFALQQLMGIVDQPWNWHVLCRTVEDYRRLLPLLASVRRFAYADEIKVQDFNAVATDPAAQHWLEMHDFAAACDKIRKQAQYTDFIRKEKIAVYDILKARPFWRQRLIDRGMAGRAEDPNKWVNPTLDEIQTHFESGAEETPVITDSRWPSEISRVLERFPEFQSVRLWAPDVPMVDDPSENSMLKENTDYVFIRGPLTPTDEPTDPAFLLHKFMLEYPQYTDFKTYVMA